MRGAGLIVGFWDFRIFFVHKNFTKNLYFMVDLFINSALSGRECAAAF